MNAVKSLIKKTASRLGYTVVRTSKPSPAGKNQIQQLEFVDGFLAGQLAAGRRISILQCGANDGVTVDPVRSFILRHTDQVNAVLVEPLPDVYDALVANYADQAQVTTLNIAVGPESEINLYRIKAEYTANYKGIIASGITSFDREYVLKKATDLLDLKEVPPEDRIERVTQKCLTVSQIIEDHADQLGVEPFVQIDAEGYDAQIIYTIDFARHRPIAINYETDHLSEEDLGKLHEYLSSKGYSFIKWKTNDELAVRND